MARAEWDAHDKDHERERIVARETAQRLEREVEQTAQRLERAVEETALRIEKAVQTALVAVAYTDTIHADAHQKEHLAHERIHNVEKMQVDKAASQTLTRLEQLESGGAPFASRLDDSLLRLKDDVAKLKDNMVRSEVLDDLRDRAAEDAKAQKRQLMYIAVAAGLSFMASLILAITRFTQ